MIAPPPPGAPAPPSPPSAAQRATRYRYLVGRLRNREITMEEATELFGIMDTMLAARPPRTVAPPPPAPESVEKPKAVAPPPGATGPNDDWLLLGLLAMGAGSGLLAAAAKRLTTGEAPRSRPAPRGGASSSGSR